MKKCYVFLSVMLLLNPVFAQVFSNKPVGKKHSDTRDSLRKTDYPFLLPIWGDKATKAGFELPYSAGVSIQTLWQKQDLIIDNLNVGFNNGPLYNLDEIVRFKNSTSEASGLNFRPDVWVFPFLNVYGIFAKAQPSTTVNYGVWVPDSTATWKEVFSTSSKAKFGATTMGFGLTPTVGVGGGFLALDMNFTWSDVDALDKPAFSFIFDPRFGKSFKFRNPERVLALWVGGFRWSINSNTSGSLPLGDLFQTDGLQAKVDAGMQKVGNAQTQVDTWWNNLTPPQQTNPVNKAKYETANRALATAGNFLNSMDAAVNNLENASVQYTLNKRPAMLWNFMIGGQFQYNKHWMIRGEYGFLGSRQHFITGLQYRFGL